MKAKGNSTAVQARKTERHAPTPSLEYHAGVKLPVHRLPFVGGESTDGGVCFWDVPAVGDYIGGCVVGKNLAAAYLKHRRQNREIGAGILQHIVLDMVHAPRNSATRGQIVGFFSILDTWLGIAVDELGASLDALNEEEIIDAANSGFTLDGPSYLQGAFCGITGLHRNSIGGER